MFCCPKNIPLQLHGDQLTTGISTFTFFCGMSPWSHLPMQRSTAPGLKTTEHSESREGIFLRKWSHKSSESPYWKDFISHLYLIKERCSDTLGQCPVAALSPLSTLLQALAHSWKNSQDPKYPTAQTARLSTQCRIIFPAWGRQIPITDQVDYSPPQQKSDISY